MRSARFAAPTTESNSSLLYQFGDWSAIAQSIVAIDPSKITFLVKETTMIQNQHQYQVTQNKLKGLERGLVELEKIKDTLHPRQFLGRLNSLSRSIGTLQQEISDYESLKQQQTSIRRCIN